MNRYSVNTYEQAMERIKNYGWMFDTGQIAPNVLTQLFMASYQGKLKYSQDTWPIRGGTITTDKTAVRTVWELATEMVGV